MNPSDIKIDDNFVEHLPPDANDDIDLKANGEPLPKSNGQYSAELTAALAGNNMSKWSKESFTLYMAIFSSLCCSYANGYDGSLMTAILAMTHWQKTMGVGTTGPIISTIFSIYTVYVVMSGKAGPKIRRLTHTNSMASGVLLGGPLSAWIMDRFGRRIGMSTGAAIIIVGSIITTTSKSVAQFIVGRFVLGVGISMTAMNAPSYSMEIAPPQWRGRATAIFNCGWYCGAIPAAAITFGTNYIDSNLSWQLPVIFQCLACVFILILHPFIPESPRFTMAQGNIEAATAFLVKYHGGGDPNSPLVHLEIAEMMTNIEVDGMDKRWWDYGPLFSTRGNRWRMLQVIMMSVFGQFSGNGLAYFATVIYENIGVTSVEAQLGYNLLYSAMCIIGAVAGALLTDHMPRRYVLTFGTLLLSVLLAIFVGLNSVITKQINTIGTVAAPIGKGAIAVYILFGVACAFTYTPLQATVTVEALSTNMRAKGLAFSNVFSQGMSFINLFAGPIGLDNIGYYYVMFFVFWDLFEAGCWWFLGVESRGRTLEELDWIYEQPNPVKASKKL